MDSMMHGKENMEAACKCPHHNVIPTFIILFGVLFLLGALDVVSAEMVNIVWPILVILGGCMKMMGGRCKCCASH